MITKPLPRDGFLDPNDGCWDRIFKVTVHRSWATVNRMLLTPVNTVVAVRVGGLVLREVRESDA
jgi:hypothetical protein